VAVKPSVILWGEYLSGDGTPSKAFNTLVATNHKLYGEQDYFPSVPKNTGNNGLIDVGGRVIVGKLFEDLKVNVDGRSQPRSFLARIVARVVCDGD
jgi:hypothetical protein